MSSKAFGIVDITFADADFVAVKQNWRVNLSYDAEEKMIEFVKIGVSPIFRFLRFKIHVRRKFH